MSNPVKPFGCMTIPTFALAIVILIPVLLVAGFTKLIDWFEEHLEEIRHAR